MRSIRMTRPTFLSTAAAVSLGLMLGAGCNKDRASTDPEAGSNLVSNSAVGGSDDEFGDLSDSDDELDYSDDMGETDEAPEKEAKKLPKRAKPVKKCRGKRKKRTCKMVDPKPKVSAAHGVVTLMGSFQWGMTSKQVFSVLAKDVEVEYAKRQEGATKAAVQDANRRWRKEQLDAIRVNHIKFTTASKHRWGVSLIQYEYEDDNSEEMIWVRTTRGLRKFYFFKDDELWKIFYAYSTDTWPGKSYADVVEEKFKKWFGVSPEQKEKKNDKGQVEVGYYEWAALDGEVIRSFDLTQVHGVIGLAVIDGNAEQRIGERLPNTTRKEQTADVLDGVLGGSDVCYSDDGTIRECTEDEALGIE